MNEHEVSEESSEKNTGELSQQESDSPQSDSEPSVAGSTELGNEDDLDGSSQDDPFEFQIAPEDLPTLQWPDIDAELAAFELNEAAGDQETQAPEQDPQDINQTGPLDGLEDAMDWLEQLAAGQGMPIDEMPTMVTAPPSSGDQLTPEIESSDQLFDTGESTQEIPMDSDPMAWLEQLAVDQSSPLEELPSVADRLLASELVSYTEVPPDSTINDPYEIDQALDYLEQLAETQSVDLSTVSFEKSQNNNSLEDGLAYTDGLAVAGLAAAAAVALEKSQSNDKNKNEVMEESILAPEQDEVEQQADLSSEMPDDPEQALAWLSGIGEEGSDEPTEVVLEDDTAASKTLDEERPDGLEDPVAPLIEGEPSQPEADVEALEEMPDDPDEAVAWMENLAKAGSEPPSGAEEDRSSKDTEPQSNGDDDRISPNAAILADAQEAFDENDSEKAFALYQSILEDEAADAQLVSALEDSIEHHGESPRLLRLLGDAYLQTGQVEKAVMTYRKGFDHL